MKEKLYRFIKQRYANDQFNRFLMILAMICFILSLFRVPGVYLIGLLCLIYAYFRMLSRNTYKRSLENNKYLQYEYKVKRDQMPQMWSDLYEKELIYSQSLM